MTIYTVYYHDGHYDHNLIVRADSRAKANGNCFYWIDKWREFFDQVVSIFFNICM